MMIERKAVSARASEIERMAAEVLRNYCQRVTPRPVEMAATAASRQEDEECAEARAAPIVRGKSPCPTTRRLE